MVTETVAIPSLVQGEIQESGNHIIRSYKTDLEDLEVTLFEPTPIELRNMALSLRAGIPNSNKRTTEETVEILSNIGSRWKDSDQLRFCLDTLPTITNRSRDTVRRDLEKISFFLSRISLRELIKHELESEDILDKPMRYRGVLKRRQPWGLMFHNLAGNSPLVALSPLMGILTKNLNLVKTASGDPITTEKIFELLSEEDKELGRRSTVIYWRGSVDGKPNVLYYVLSPQDLTQPPLIDAVTLWGDELSVSEARKIFARAGVYLIEHGPKYSLDAILREDYDKSIYQDIVDNDIIPHEQEACNSCRVVLVKGNVKRFAEGLKGALELAQEKNPKRLEDFEYGRTVASRMAYLLDKKEGKGEIYVPKGGKPYWTVVHLNAERELKRSDLDVCMRRFIVVKEITDENEIVDFIVSSRLERYLQTIGVYGSEDERQQLAGKLSLHGASAITYPGQLGIKRPGESHDGIYNLREFTRLTTTVSEPNPQKNYSVEQSSKPHDQNTIS